MDETQYGSNFPRPMPSSDHPQDQSHNGKVNIQVLTGPPHIKIGHVALVCYNLPICEVNMDGETILTPCVQLTARQAMEIGMNMIHIAKVAENYQKEVEG